MKITIDCGHGALPYDTGAVGFLKEDHEVRLVGDHLKIYLEKSGHQVNIIKLNSCESVGDSLKRRVQASNTWGSDLYVSLHMNAFNEKAHGTEVIAISNKSKEYAGRVVHNLSTLGFKNRGVKRNDFYVLVNTDCPAILVETCFVDNKEDSELYNALGANRIAIAIGDAINGAKTPLPGNLTKPATPATPATPSMIVTPPTPENKPTSKKVIDILDKCDTGLARGLSLQMIAKVNRMVKKPLLVIINHPLIDISSPAVNPYLQANAYNSLLLAVKERNKTMVINSCYRTTIQQHILKEQLKRSLCGLTAVAPPGRSNHEKGLAIDIEDAQGWKPYLEDHGWSWIGAFDPMHFDYWNGIGDLGRLGVSACQLLHNEHNKDQLAIDGQYGEMTAKAINNFPIDGW